MYKGLLRKLRACWHILRSERYICYNSEDATGNRHRWHTSERVLSDDVANLQDWAAEIVRDNNEAGDALNSLLNLNPNISPAS